MDIKWRLTHVLRGESQATPSGEPEAVPGFALLLSRNNDNGLLRKVAPAILKTFVIRSFSDGKWRLTHVLRGESQATPSGEPEAVPGFALCYHYIGDFF